MNIDMIVTFIRAMTVISNITAKQTELIILSNIFIAEFKLFKRLITINNHDKTIIVYFEKKGCIT